MPPVELPRCFRTRSLCAEFACCGGVVPPLDGRDFIFDLARSPGHRQFLAGPDVERHPVPAPGVDPQPQCRERLHFRVGRHPLLAAVAENCPRTTLSGPSGAISLSTLTFSSRTDSLSIPAGGSIV